MMKSKQQDSLFGSSNFDETASAIVKLHFFHSTWLGTHMHSLIWPKRKLTNCSDSRLQRYHRVIH
jgi:hypothetical protein